MFKPCALAVVPHRNRGQCRIERGRERAGGSGRKAPGSQLATEAARRPASDCEQIAGAAALVRTEPSTVQGGVVSAQR